MIILNEKAVVGCPWVIAIFPGAIQRYSSIVGSKDGALRFLKAFRSDVAFSKAVFPVTVHLKCHDFFLQLNWSTALECAYGSLKSICTCTVTGII